MSDILIRDLPEDLASALTAKAQAAGKDRMTYIRDLLIKDAAEPLVRDRYAIHFHADESPAKGLIRRFGGTSNKVSTTYDGPTTKQLQAITQAETFVRRNGPGDREEAIYVLKSHFNNVYEVPV